MGVEFKYSVNACSPNPKLFINQHLGVIDDKSGVIGKDFAKELFEIDSYCPVCITIYVNSTGGDVNDGYEILNAIQECKSFVRVIITGFAYSTAGWCILSANEIWVYDYSSGMCHDPKSVNGKKSQFSDVVKNSIVKIISGKSGRNGVQKLSEQQVSDLMSGTTYFSGKDLVTRGLADRIINKEIDVSKFEYKDFQILNMQIIEEEKPTHKMLTPQILNRLNLNEDATEEQITNKLTEVLANNDTLSAKITNLSTENIALQTKTNESLEKQLNLNTQILELKNKIAEHSAINADAERLKTEKEALELKLQTATNQLQEIETEKLKAENEAKEKAADELVERFSTRIPDENKITVRSMAIRNYEETKVMLEMQAVNMQLPSPVKVDANKERKELTPDDPGYYKALNNKPVEEGGYRTDIKKA